MLLSKSGARRANQLLLMQCTDAKHSAATMKSTAMFLLVLNFTGHFVPPLNFYEIFAYFSIGKIDPRGLSYQQFLTVYCIDWRGVWRVSGGVEVGVGDREGWRWVGDRVRRRGRE